MSTRVNNTKVIISARASYLHAFEPDSINGSDPKYSVSLIIDKKDTDLIAKIKKAVEQAKEDGKSKWGGKIPANLKLPLRDGDLDRPEDEAYAFDVVRIHKFGNLDAKVTEEIETTKLPSFKAMKDFASENEAVRRTLSKEREESARLDFAEEDWKMQLEYNRQGIVVNNLRNLLLILNNDEKLKSIVFNQLSDGMEIKGKVPWNHPSKFWRDADDAQLISYIDLNYGNFSARNYDIAVSKVTDDRSYHPIKEFLAALPEWDEIPRVDTLLVDFLGAADNAYVRAVTRKTLVAAIARVMNPGCKFDTMLVLSGPQGKGKSTLIAKLCGEWFNDSLLLSDTKDKTAAEKLQGYWILEIGELAGLKKTDIETLRGFLSRQNDIYRAAFGRRATPHPRQCVFIGTTNADTYLRDITGNRRFWPVKNTGRSRKGFLGDYER